MQVSTTADQGLILYRIPTDTCSSLSLLRLSRRDQFAFAVVSAGWQLVLAHCTAAPRASPKGCVSDTCFCGSLCVLAGDYDSDGTITPEAYLRHAQDWAAAGADIIGGCCGVGPQHMQLLASRLK